MSQKFLMLKESELLRLIKRMVAEAEEKMDDTKTKEPERKEKKKSSFSWIQDAIMAAKDLASDAISDLDDEELEELKDNLPKVDVRSLPKKIENLAKNDSDMLEDADSDIMTEGYLTENKTRKMIKLLSNVGILSGLGLSAAGLLGFMSHAMGYTDAGALSSFFIDVHEMIQDEFGCENFCGPLSTLIAFAGLIMAVGSLKMKNR